MEFMKVIVRQAVILEKNTNQLPSRERRRQKSDADKPKQKWLK
jgi:hypothetical protein